MRKTLLITVASIAMLVSVASAMMFPFSAGAQGNNNPNKLWGAPTYVLNILGKKTDWNGQPDYDSDRHTMFVPEDVGAFLTSTGFPDAKIWITQGPEFVVQDPNMFDDGQANFTLGPGKYEVYFVALGKPGSTATLEGWIYNATGNEYLLYLGSVSVSHSKRPDWQSGHALFWVTPTEAASIGVTISEDMWIFDFLNLLESLYPGTQYLYLWKLVSGCKHIQVRFYQIA